MRNECYRFTSPVSQWQVWFQRPPHDGKTCLWIILNEGGKGGDKDITAVHVHGRGVCTKKEVLPG